MTSSKTETARHLEIIADMLEFSNGNSFGVKAYRNAADIIRKAEGSLDTLIASGELKNIKGIGKGIYQAVVEFTGTGTSEALTELKKELPDSFFDLFCVRGLGPKKIRQLYTALDIQCLDDLEFACLRKMVRGVKGFTKNTEIKLLVEIERVRQSKSTVLIHHAFSIRDNILGILAAIPGVLKCAEAGSLRRVREVYSVIEFVALVSGTKPVLDYMKQHYSFMFDSGCIQLEGYMVPVRIYLTSTEAEYEARQADLLIAGTGLSDSDMSDPETCESEYYHLNEIEFCRKVHDLQPEHLKGLFHFHTVWSDGVSTLRQMIEEGQRLGYTHFAVCDHSKTASYAGGLTEERVMRQKDEIFALRSELGITILHGIESDILTNGSLDYDDDFLRNFDFIVASVHSSFNMSREDMTNRVIKAVEHERTNVLAHPTGRVLLRRDAYDIDMRRVIDACAANHTAIEINANPLRLDLDWRWLPYARAKGCLFAINADAHSVDDIELARFGVMIARKGGIPPTEIINCFELDEFMAFLSSKCGR